MALSVPFSFVPLTPPQVGFLIIMALSAPILIFLLLENCYTRSHCVTCVLSRIWGCSVHTHSPPPFINRVDLALPWWVDLPSSLLHNVPPKANWSKGENALLWKRMAIVHVKSLSVSPTTLQVLIVLLFFLHHQIYPLWSRFLNTAGKF